MQINVVIKRPYADNNGMLFHETTPFRELNSSTADVH